MNSQASDHSGESVSVTLRTYKSLASLALDWPSDVGSDAAKPIPAFDMAGETMPLPELSTREVGPGRTSEPQLLLRTRELAWEDAQDGHEPEYVLKRELGAGGMGTVYEAQQACAGRSVAVKVLRAELASMEHAVKAFTSEAAVTAELEHPCIVPLYDLGHSELNGGPFYAMKQVHGQPWTRTINQQSNAERVEILTRAGDALAFAHSRGIIHRDLKPDNVMIGDFGEVLVMDWGLAVSVPLAAGDNAVELMLRPHAMRVTESTFGGTPGYMAPELTGPDFNKIGIWSDVYLLGAVLWRAVTGRPPHVAETLRECVANARANVIAEPENKSMQSCDEVGSAELLAIARKAMATEPKDRHVDVRAFQADLRAWQSHAQSAALTRRAASLLASARNSNGGGYHDFAMSIYTYEEALNMWRENPCAADGLREARLASARMALQRGDLELAESVLAEAGGEAVDRSLHSAIAAARKERACSEHHRATLVRTAEKWSLAFELSPDAMIILRQEDAIILEANANFEKATGWARNEVIGHSTAELGLWAEPEQRTKFISELQDAGEVQGFRTRFRRRSGEIYDVLVSACVAEFEGVRAVVANSRDISNLVLA